MKEDILGPYETRNHRFRMKKGLPCGPVELFRDGEKVAKLRLDPVDGVLEVNYRFTSVRFEYAFKQYLSTLPVQHFKDVGIDNNEQALGWLLVELIDAGYPPLDICSLCRVEVGG